MRRSIKSLIVSCILLGVLAPTATAGPGSEICMAAQAAYEKVTQRPAPFECLQ